MGSMGELMKLCRLCLVKDKVNVPIFEGAGDIRKISQKISACLPVKVAKDDKLPKKICGSCSHKLDIVYLFWKTTTASEKQLLEWVKNAASIQEEEEDRAIEAEHIVLKQEVDNGDSEALDAGEFIDVNETFDSIGYSRHDDDDDMSNEHIAVKTENDNEPPHKKQKAVSLSSGESEEDGDDTADAYNRDDSDDEDNEMNEAQPTFVSVSDADQQPGPSGVGKSSGDAPLYKAEVQKLYKKYESFYNLKKCVVLLGDIENVDTTKYKLAHQKHKLIVEVNPANIIRDCRRNKYKCEICDLKFKDYVMLESHKDIHKPQPNKIIEVEKEEDTEDVSTTSSSSTDSEREEVENISSDESEKDVQEKNVCVYCNRVFKYNWTLAKHLRQHDHLVCKDCVILFKSKVELDKHMSDAHRLYPCKICSQKFFSFQNYKNHAFEKHNDYNEEDDRVCNICKIQFVSFDQLVEHNSTLQHQFKCKVCKKELYTDALLTSHKNVHINAPPNNLLCKNCTGVFFEVAEFYNHSQFCKKDTSHKICDICSLAFMDSDTLEKHVATHFAPPKSTVQPKPPKMIPIAQKIPEFKCALCNKLFFTDSMLQEHLKNHLTVHTTPNTGFQIPKPITSANLTTNKTIPTIQVQMPSLQTINANSLIQTSLQSTPIISNPNMITTNPLIINQGGQTKILLTSDDKRCFLLTPVSSVQEGGVIKYTVTQSPSPLPLNTQPQIFQGIPALQPINNFLQPAINQTIVLPPAQNNSQISITNQTYNTSTPPPNLNQGTANIVFNTAPVSKPVDTKPPLRTYISRLKTTPTLVKIQPQDNNTNVKPSTSGSAGTSNITKPKENAASGNIPVKAQIIIKTIETSKTPTYSYNKITKEITKITPGKTSDKPRNQETPTKAVENNDTFKPKIFLKPLSQLLQNPVASNDKEIPITAKETDTALKVNVESEVVESIIVEPAEASTSESKTKIDPLSDLVAELTADDNVKSPIDPLLIEKEKSAEPEPEAGPSKIKVKKDLSKIVKKYKCSMCGISCKRQGKLIAHQNKYKCKICKHTCCKLKALDVHYRNMHHFKNRCASCDMQFPTNMELQIHKKDVHLCVKCNRCYLDLKKHKTSFTCLNCEFNACDSFNLDAHYRLVHSITTRCGPCNSIFYTAESFAHHKQEIHFCSKCRTYKMDLNIHKTFCKGTSNEEEKQLEDSQPAEVIELDDSE